MLLLVASAAAFAVWDTTVPRPPAVTEHQWTTIGHIITAALFVAALLTIRRALFARLAYRPGAVEVTSFGTTSPETKSPETKSADEVLAEFRQKLTTMSLSAPQSVPNEPSADSVLDNVKTATDGSANMIATIAGLVRAVIQVRHAYRVSAQLRTRPGPRPRGITISITALPGGRGEIDTFWSDDWASVAERAAHFVGAFILPHTRLSRRAPWTAWRGYEMPSELFHQSQLAHHHVRNREYEKALVAFHRALKMDPQNPYLRVELAQTQEQLGLFVDALASYADVVAIESWYDRRLWLRLRALLGDYYAASGEPPHRFRRSRSGRDALLIARYRLVCRLAAADQLAEQWSRVVPITAETSPGQVVRNRIRAAERRALIDRLKVWLRSYVREYNDAMRTRFELDDLIQRPPRLRHFLQYVAYRETTHLVDDYRWSRGRRRPGMPVTQTSLEVLSVWAPLYLDYAASGLDDGGNGPSSTWPRSPRELDAELDAILRRKPARAQEWQEHYNATCTLVVAMRGWREHTSEHKELRLRAVRHLERAVSCSDSSYVGQFSQWLSVGDQDLNPLRSTPQFVDYLDRYLPNEEPRSARPVKLLPVLISTHTMRLLQEYAHLRASYWEGELRPDADALAIKDETDRENRARRIARAFALDDRDWRTRIKLIDEMDDFARRRHRASPGSALPQFQEDPDVRRYELLGPVVQGRTLAYPDEYFDTIVALRDEHWKSILKLLPEQPELAGARQPDIASCLQFWRRLDGELDAVLTRDAPPAAPRFGSPAE
ncbi:tetratricopeptide repeat protein [Pseudonocardia acaciae]|uniref:tetratricopeptide repeat protein n=1 Tax=Pseudonocardia acaciae TaxID=551276 RepID=UPI00146FFCC3|nr:tetratricopeptide repeat protein [Pseudonocardia acaciae]